MGFLLLDAGRPAEGADFFGNVLERAPGGSPLAMLGLARACLDLGMIPDAVRWMENIPEYFRHQDSYRDLSHRIKAAAAPQAQPTW
jgi:hypothetical protein